MSHPACFGSPTAVSHACETCQACDGAGACIEQAIAFLETLPNSPMLKTERLRLSMTRQALVRAPHAAVGVTPPARKGRAALTQEQQRIVGSLGKVVGSMAKQLFERGWYDFARRELRAGRNPGRNDWQRIMCAGLLGGGVSRSELQMAFQQQLSITSETARVRVSKAVSLFLAGGLVRENAGRLVINPN